MTHRPLYVQLYVALLACILVCLLGVAVAFRLLRDTGGPPADHLRRAASVLAEAGPEPDAPNARERIDALANELGVDILIGGPGGEILFGSTSQRPFLAPMRPGPGWRQDRHGLVLVTDMGDGRWIAVRARGAHRPPRILHPFFAALFGLAAVMALASYPVARRVTRRLEALTAGVERWGKGDLAHRVPTDGEDEVAALAAAFNQAGERLRALLEQQRQMLATASHELRSPLARLRLGIELLVEAPDGDERTRRAAQMRGDVVELDALIEEILLHARADGRVPRRPPEPVDVAALVREEAARAGGADVSVTAASAGAAVVAGDAVMLRHLVRNLLENAERHGGGRGVRALVDAPGDGGVTIAVEDEGPGIPPAERERIFAPFYRAPGGGGAPGHGLGLALVRQVAHYHGGAAVYRPRPGGGSRFEVTLRDLAAPAAAPPPPAA